ncbi:MAG: PEGA domain-containing protein [Candidatus Woykebacteria bacterium]
MKRLTIFISLVFIFVAAALVLVVYGMGYRLNWGERKIAGTGILSITSVPSGAAVYINEELRGATDNSITNLPPGKYKVRLSKEGFSDWVKELEVEKERVMPIEVYLFPSAPSLSALTFTGVISPNLSPDGQKIAYGIENNNNEGLWVLDFGTRQLIFSKSPQQIVKDTSSLRFSESSFVWASDSRSILSTLKDSSGKTKSFLLDSGRLNETFDDVSTSSKDLQDQWKKDEDVKQTDRLSKLGEEAEKLSLGSSKLIFSPDEKRVLILKGKEDPLVYDSEPSIVPGSEAKTFKIPKALSYIWYPTTSKHIVLIKEDSISIVESDGQNEMAIYTGEFGKEEVFPWSDGTRLVIATTLNTANSKKPNLYSISLK